MADKLAIYRGALRLLGEQTIASLSEDAPARRALDNAWEPAVEFLLTQGLWQFAERAVELDHDDDVEARFGWTYAFSKPDDWIRTIAISDEPRFLGQFNDFEDTYGYWFGNSDTLYVRFVSDDADYGWNVGAWRQPFAKTLEAYLAFESGLPVSGDKTTRDDMYQLYESRLKRAKILDAFDERTQFPPPGRLTQARGAWGRGRSREKG